MTTSGSRFHGRSARVAVFTWASSVAVTLTGSSSLYNRRPAPRLAGV